MDETTKLKLENYFQKYNLLRFKKGDLIFKSGENLPGICYIKKGYVRLYTITKDGEEITLQLFKPVFYFSMIYEITGIQNRYYFEAITPVEMWVAPKAEAMEFIASDNIIKSDIMKAVLTGFVDLTTNIEQLISGNAYSKVARIIHSMSEKFGEKKGKRTTIKFATPHRMIASLTGLTRETVTLQMLRLEKEGVVDNKGKFITVNDSEELRKIASI